MTLPVPGVTSDISGLVGPVVTAVGQYVQLLESICLLSSGFFFSCVGKLDMCLILYWLVKQKIKNKYSSGLGLSPNHITPGYNHIIPAGFFMKNRTE